MLHLPLRVDGDPGAVLRCANGGVIAEPGPRCPVCDGGLADDGRCANTVCTLPDRAFHRIHTVSARSEDLWRVLYR